MLSKLIKYDIRAGWRDFVGTYMAIILAVLILPVIFKYPGNEIADAIAGSIAIAIIIGTIVMVIINLFTIFNTNVFSKEGYLTMTLPVKSHQIVISKLLVSAMWIVLTGIVAIIGLIIFTVLMNGVQIAGFTEAIKYMMSILGGQSILAVILIIIALIASVVKEIAKLFLACSVAHLRQLSRFRIPVGILSYFAFSWLEVAILEILSNIIGLFVNSDEIVRQINLINDTGDIQMYFGLFSGIMIFGILYALALITAYSMANVWILNHKLDLD